MKKILILVLIAVFMFVTVGYVVADQLIKNNGYHNISGRLTLTGGTSTEICAYCHLPHRANTSAIALGNRTATNATALCQSCHDGTAVNNSTYLLRNPLSGTLGTGSINTGSNAYIQPNTHKVGGINHPAGTVSGTTYGWSAAGGPQGKVNANAGLASTAAANTALGAQYALDPVGSGAKDGVIDTGLTIQCTSCHYVHRAGSTADRAMLRIPNSNSALCLACHNL